MRFPRHCGKAGVFRGRISRIDFTAPAPFHSHQSARRPKSPVSSGKTPLSSPRPALSYIRQMKLQAQLKAPSLLCIYRRLHQHCLRNRTSEHKISQTVQNPFSMIQLNPLQHMWMAANHQISARVDVLMSHLPLVRLWLRVPLDTPVDIDNQIITLFLYLLDLLHDRSRVIRRKHARMRRSCRPSARRKDARRAQKTNLFPFFSMICGCFASSRFFPPQHAKSRHCPAYRTCPAVRPCRNLAHGCSPPSRCLVRSPVK